jgi:tetratricopeptide (TPR) repeat protein
VPLFERGIEIVEKQENKQNIAIGLGNLGKTVQIQIGELDSAESNLRRSIEICREIKDEYREASGHFALSQILTFQGEFRESEQESYIAMNMLRESEIQQKGKLFACRSLRALLISSAEEALKHARKARELADSQKNEIDIIEAEYLLGAAHLMKGDHSEAEKHLTEALLRDRKINLIEFEPDILLELAKLRFKLNHKPEAFKFADEALHIADRCEYRLKQADIHNSLSEFYLDVGDLAKAREHGEIAKERAECGYVPAMEKAEKLLKEIHIKTC